MPMSNLRKEFLTFLNQPDMCELFYIYMKSEHVAYVLEFYLACDGLRNLSDSQPNPQAIIELIYKHYLSNGKVLSSSKRFSLPKDFLLSIKQRLIKHEFHWKFYDQAQEYVFKYMLQMCYPKFLIEQQNSSPQQAIFNPMYRYRMKDQHPSNLNSLEGSREIGLNNQSRTIKLMKHEKGQYNLAQQNPAAFFEELKFRLTAYQNKTPLDSSTSSDDPSTILDLQIAKTIDDADNYLWENSINPFPRYDSGVCTDCSEKNDESSIDVIWYPSLDNHHALLSTIPYVRYPLTLKEFRQLFQKPSIYRYFFKTICTPDINQEQYVFRELTMDNELIPFYNGKIFVQLDRISFV